ncbi:DUF3164 family protein [Brucella pseudogrignonensis]|uniref:EF-hand domain-containing protein n=1 Tax=Brucella pseudogrignonensis TaxID=419475 RepID=A0A256GDG7_9HYPH|nr:DUF3164 family protein [Brucella pseudogrignonensis]OYR25194.1 hypothetical protein CEV34_2771 [Brucella pseudogrignonensis]
MTEALAACILEEQPEQGITMVNGKPYMANAKGALVPLELVKPADKLRDETVRKVMGYAKDISAQISRFRKHSMTDLDSLDEVLEQEYNARPGGVKGNRTYQTIDGLKMVKVSINDFEVAGPELQVAKSLIDECLNEWTDGARAEIRAIITRAFDTDKEGKINLKEIKKLTKLDISDQRWKDAMRAIEDAIDVQYSKQYVRFYERASVQDEWTAVTVDIAKA